MKTTDLIEGFFDVRIYQDGKPREQWRLKNDDDNISFSCSLTKVGDFERFAKKFEKNGETYYRVTFKIGRNCRWYNERAEAVARPSNESLDGKRFAAKVQYREVIPEDMSGKAPRGYWVSAIMFKAIDDNPFTAMEGSSDYCAKKNEEEPDNVREFLSELGAKAMPY